MEKKILDIEQFYTTDNKHENYIKYFRISPWKKADSVKFKIINRIKYNHELAILIKNKEKNKFGANYEIFSFSKTLSVLLDVTYISSYSFNNFADIVENIDKWCFIYIVECSPDSFIKYGKEKFKHRNCRDSE